MLNILLYKNIKVNVLRKYFKLAARQQYQFYFTKITGRLEISKICVIIKIKKENKFKAKIFQNIYFLCSMPPSVSLMLNFKHIGR